MKITKIVPITILANGIWCDPDCPHAEMEEGVCLLGLPDDVTDYEGLEHWEWDRFDPNIPGYPKHDYEYMGRDEWLKANPDKGRFPINECTLTCEERVRTRFCYDNLGPDNEDN